jgi:hypothetical protein
MDLCLFQMEKIFKIGTYIYFIRIKVKEQVS